jgi:hypothetical protein
MDTQSSGSESQMKVPANQTPETLPLPEMLPPNTSGHGTETVIPQEIKGWSWGAFLLSWIWGIGNRTYIAFLCFVPVLNLVMIFILGAKGNEWAWRNKHWESVEAFKRTQKKWMIAGLVIFGLGILSIVSLFIFGSSIETTTSTNGGQTPADQAGRPAMPLSTAPATVEAETFDFLGTHYVFGDNLSTGTEDFYEFLPEGQTFDHWESMVTLVRDNARPATLSDADGIAQATLDGFKKQGAFVYNSFTATSTVERNPDNVMTVVFTETGKAEIDIKKIFLDDDNRIVSDTYAVMVAASSSADFDAKVNNFLDTSKNIGPVFINTEFPSPWNL